MSMYSRFFLPAAVALSLAGPANAAIDIKARQYMLMDFQTGTVLEAKDADKPMPPSSMAKLMTGYLVFEALKNGKISLDDQLTVSRHAWKEGGAASGGSTMFLDVNSKAKVEDLIRGMIIQSGNDACIVLAEGIAGSEEAFAQAMTAKAKELGLTNSHFVNATGLPDDQQYMSPHDLAILAKRIIVDFPEYFPIYSETSFTYNNITQGNRNPLLYRVGSGADGMKTGHTEIAGYGLTGTAIRNGRRLILVANGMNSIKDRDEETAKLLDYGFREFVNRSLFTAGETVTNADVWLGDGAAVPLVVPKDVAIALPRASVQSMEVKVVYDNPVPAPIAKGTTLGKLTVTARDLQPIEIPLQAAADVGRLGLVGRLKAAASYIFLGPPPPQNGAPQNGTAQPAAKAEPAKK
ncbi:MAG: D-alanyl-D-alanine carboxypeptidase [Rhodospirillaceae bacterium]|nr:D-alanyl-D-alanine carboxypeptidase [Rhodospirillaceae bacterium]